MGNTIKGVIDEPGNYHIRAIASDTSGNSAEIAFTITVNGEDGFDDEGEKKLTFGMFILPIISLVILIIVIILYFILRKKDEEQAMPPLPPELTGETTQSGPDDELERLFQSSYNGDQ
jgi:predicted RND superfamily exporter protein